MAFGWFCSLRDSNPDHLVWPSDLVHYNAEIYISVNVSLQVCFIRPRCNLDRISGLFGITNIRLPCPLFDRIPDIKTQDIRFISTLLVEHHPAPLTSISAQTVATGPGTDDLQQQVDPLHTVQLLIYQVFILISGACKNWRRKKHFRLKKLEF